MQLWSLILLFGVYFHWTVAELEDFKNYVAHVEKKTLNGLTLIGSDKPTTIELSGLHIEYIQENVFDNFTDMTILDLAKNKIQKLPPRVFSKLTKLTGLSLADNYLSDISGLFVGLNNLEILVLSRNPIQQLNRGDLFGVTRSTTVLTIGNEFDYLSSGVFHHPFVDVLPFETEYHPYNEYTDEPTGSAVPLPDAYGVKICKTDNGIMESVEEWKDNEKLGDCFRANIQRKERILKSNFQTLRKFQPGWYKLPLYAISGIDLSFNDIPEITPEVFNDLPPSFIFTDLTSNRIRIIRRNVIVNSYLRTLILNSNNIEIIEDGAFERTNITSLRLKANLLKNLAFVKTLPTSIKGLVVSSNLISNIPADTFLNLTKLQMIDLGFNFLKEIEPGTFKNQKNLWELRLIYNNFTDFNSSSFEGLRKLELLDLSHNGIESITRNTFSGLPKSQDLKLYLKGNQINAVGEGSFSDIKIFVLDLSSNRISDKSIAKGAFNRCRIEIFALSRNFMNKIESESFRGIQGSYVLDLADNQIYTIEKGDAQYLSNVRILNLDNNPLKDLGSGALYGLSTSKDVRISLKGTRIELIHGGVFQDDLTHRDFYDIV